MVTGWRYSFQIVVIVIMVAAVLPVGCLAATSIPSTQELTLADNGLEISAENDPRLAAVPPVVVSIAPTGVVYGHTTTFRWYAVVGATRYFIQVYKGTTLLFYRNYTATQFGCPAGTGQCGLVSPVSFSAAGYSWWVRAGNATGFGAWSTRKTFSVSLARPIAARPISPYGTVASNRPSFRWYAVSNATSYSLQVDKAGSSFIRKIYSSAQAGCSSGSGQCAVYSPNTLSEGSYTWKIITWNPNGYGPASTTISMIVRFTGRSWPNTSSGIKVFNDQIANYINDAQWRFSATHYVGAQKLTRADANRVRAINPGFVILHYRLGLGLGYRSITSGCLPNGDWLNIIKSTWVREWPATVQESWFYHYPESGTTRVLNCDWGWYTTELNSATWRSYWQGETLSQIQANDDDGVFMDSMSVPNYLGWDRYTPHLPEVNSTFENAWAVRIRNYLAWLQTQPIGNYAIIPNVGYWITSRETTDYRPADGVMIEGFALEADASPFAYEDWKLQMNRILGLVSLDKIIIAQSYVSGDQERMYALGSYLLIKGNHTYINIDVSEEPEWWAEYDIPIGTPVQSAGTNIANLIIDEPHGIYRRNYDNGFVLVNATNLYDGTGNTVTIDLGGTYYLAVPSGGGVVPESGVPTGSLDYQAVTEVTLNASSAAVLLNSHP